MAEVTMASKTTMAMAFMLLLCAFLVTLATARPTSSLFNPSNDVATFEQKAYGSKTMEESALSLVYASDGDSIDEEHNQFNEVARTSSLDAIARVDSNSISNAFSHYVQVVRSLLCGNSSGSTRKSSGGSKISKKKKNSKWKKKGWSCDDDEDDNGGDAPTTFSAVATDDDDDNDDDNEDDKNCKCDNNDDDDDEDDDNDDNNEDDDDNDNEDDDDNNNKHSKCKKSKDDDDNDDDNNNDDNSTSSAFSLSSSNVGVSESIITPLSSLISTGVDVSTSPIFSPSSSSSDSDNLQVVAPISSNAINIDSISPTSSPQASDDVIELESSE